MPTAFILVPILIPIVTGIIMLLVPFRDAHKRNVTVEVIVLITTALTFLLLKNPPAGTLHLFSLGDRLPMTLRIDGMATFFGGLVAFLWPLASLYSFEYMRHEERVNTFLAFYTITYGVTLGVAFAGNIFSMYLFYELLTIVTLPLVMHTMTPAARRATREYLYYMFGGTAFAFIGMIFYAIFSLDIEFTYGGSLNLARLARYPEIVQIVYVLTFMGFGVKAAVFPFHGWLPDASVAPTPVTALLHAVAVVKSGVFAVMRLTYYCFGYEYLSGTRAQTVVLAVSMLTIAYASTLGVRETHLKRRLAYSTVSNLSYILLGASAMSPLGLFAALAHMFFHAIMKISAFFCAGAVMHQTKKNYVYELDGLGRRMPVTFGSLLIAGMSLIGMPFFSGFVSKWLIADSLFKADSPAAIIGIFALLYSALMTAIYLITIVIRAFFPHRGYRPRDIRDYTDPNWLMTLPLAVFSLLTVLFGIWSEPLLNLLWQIASGAV